MYFSYSPSPPSTSYASSPMDIPSSSSNSQSPSCAYPSWPRRSSLSSGSNHSEVGASVNSYISDEDLFPCVFDDFEQDCTPPTTPHSVWRSPVSPAAMLEPRVADHSAYMRELVAQDKLKAERRRHRSSSRKSRSSSASKQHMSPIQEAGE